MKRVIIAGSPRSNGRSARLAEMLFEASIDERPEDEVYLVPVSELDIGPCTACGACRNETEAECAGENGEVQTARGHFCVVDDEMQDVYPLVDEADELVVVSPVFFSGAPASLKALLDRLQPYFWANRTEDGSARNPRKRPATLHVVGEGGDPHGYAPLVGEARSALAVAGFKVERILDWVGKIDAQGEITAEAEEVDAARFLPGDRNATTPAAALQGSQGRGSQGAHGSHGPQGQGASPDRGQSQARVRPNAERQRPKLDLGAHKQGSQQEKPHNGQSTRRQGGAQERRSGSSQGKGRGASQGNQQGKQQGKRQTKQQAKGKRRG